MFDPDSKEPFFAIRRDNGQAVLVGEFEDEHEARQAVDTRTTMSCMSMTQWSQFIREADGQLTVRIDDGRRFWVSFHGDKLTTTPMTS